MVGPYVPNIEDVESVFFIINNTDVGLEENSDSTVEKSVLCG